MKHTEAAGAAHLRVLRFRPRPQAQPAAPMNPAELRLITAVRQCTNAAGVLKVLIGISEDIAARDRRMREGVR